ncbi:MAG TPA: TetR/AcrR family transcriptional regulator [Rhizomicrobium sp.]|nr:TetR/AcrR family transcriptional regulator [Rhizomicrobium sp.]
MDNAARSERSRNAALDAALTIIARDGPARLTLDAISRESGISKGGLMHQFRTKDAVLKALLEKQTEHFDAFARSFNADAPGRVQPLLAMQIATLREAISTPRSVVFAVLGAAAQDPNLMAAARDRDTKKIEAIKEEASDADLALLRWVAAWGLALTSMMGLSPLSKKDRARLFERLLDDRQWVGLVEPRQSARAPKRKDRQTRSR